MVDRSDAAYAFAQDASRAEAKRAAQAATKREPSALLNIIVAAALIAVATTHFQSGSWGFGLFFVALAAFNGFTAYRVWRKRSSLAAGHAEDV